MRAKRVVFHRRGGAPPADSGAGLTLRTSSAGDGIVVLAVDGEIDLHTAPTLGRSIAEVHDPTLVVDLSAVRFLSAKGLTVLLNAAFEAAATGRRFGVVAAGRPVLRPLQVSGLTRSVPTYGTVADAIRHLVG